MSPPPHRDSSRVVVSWVRAHGRSAALAELLDADAVFMPWARAGQPTLATLIGYLRSSARTAREVWRRRRGGIVVVMLPPVFGLLVALPARWRAPVTLVADLHSGAYNDPRWRWTHRVQTAALRRVDLVVVTNLELLAGIAVDRGRVLVVHDPPAALPSGRVAAAVAGTYVLFPCSGAWDEPVDAVLAAAELLEPDGITVVLTGGTGPAGAALRTGFLDDETYAATVRGAAAILALTTREATMQRAAYEALDAGRPVVCSDTRALRAALGDAAVFTDHDPASIRAAVLSAVRESALLVARGAQVRAAMREQAARFRTELLRRHADRVRPLA